MKPSASNDIAHLQFVQVFCLIKQERDASDQQNHTSGIALHFTDVASQHCELRQPSTKGSIYCKGLHRQEIPKFLSFLLVEPSHPALPFCCREEGHSQVTANPEKSAFCDLMLPSIKRESKKSP